MNRNLVGPDHDGSWQKMRWKDGRRLYGGELLTEPNWVYDEEGRWQYAGEGPRERIVLPDGPTDKRVPVNPKESVLLRWLRTIVTRGRM